eukprot:633510-Amorphochlora_amoeboformis.AAC.3
MSSITKKTWRSSLRYNSYVSSSSNRKYSINISAAHAIRAQITTETDDGQTPSSLIRLFGLTDVVPDRL